MSRDNYWLLFIPLALTTTALWSGNLVAKLGVAISCACIVLFTSLKSGARNHLFVVIALVLSAAGDWFLSNRQGRESYFIVGIALFFCAHCGFLSFAWTLGRLNVPALGTLLVIYLPYYWLILRPAIDHWALGLSVLLYLLISCLGLAVALGICGLPRMKWLFVGGIGWIVFSDTLISLGEFVKWRNGNWLILPTYYLAHLCITTAVLLADSQRSTGQSNAEGE